MIGAAAASTLPPAVPHPLLDRLFSCFERDGVRWALLHAPAGGLTSPRGDIDLVVHPADIAMARRLANENGFARVPRPGPSHHYLRYCTEGDRWLWLHIVGTISFGRRHAVAADGESGWLAGRSTRDVVRQLRPELMFWVLLWHCLAGRGAVAPHHRQTLTAHRSAVSVRDLSAQTFAAACGEAKLPARVLRCVALGEWQTLEGCAPVVRAAVRPSLLIRRVAHRARRAAITLTMIPRMPGLSVAVVGPDGAGKSTLIESIRNTVPLPTRVIYMGLSGGALRHARRLRVPGLVFAASAAIIWARYLRGRYHQGLGHLVLFDRYVYDAFTPHPAQLTTAQHLSRRASGFLCPQPDVTIFLDAPGSVMHARKQSYTAPMLEDWRWHFRSLETRISRLHVIDATRSLDAVRVDAVTEIWHRCAFRWQRADAMSGCA